MHRKLAFGLMVVSAVAVLAAGTLAKDKGKEADEAPIKGSIAVGKAKLGELPGLAKISLVDAIQAAVAKTPGKAFKARIDTEDGFLVYEVEVLTADAKWVEMLVDAGDGKVLAVKADTDGEDDHEGHDGEGEHEGDEGDGE
jgi:uncharacterized membrane protein YkoI